MTTQVTSRTTLDHRQWMRLAAEEYHRLDGVLGSLSGDQWGAPTDCAGWTVSDIVAHLAGAAEATASAREQLRQQRLGSKDKGNRLQIDAVNEIQVLAAPGATYRRTCRLPTQPASGAH